jgi:hypothetical protein
MSVDAVVIFPLGTGALSANIAHEAPRLADICLI